MERQTQNWSISYIWRKFYIWIYKNWSFNEYFYMIKVISVYPTISFHLPLVGFPYIFWQKILTEALNVHVSFKKNKIFNLTSKLYVIYNLTQKRKINNWVFSIWPQIFYNSIYVSKLAHVATKPLEGWGELIHVLTPLPPKSFVA